MSLSRRKKIAEIAISHDIWIIEDEVGCNYLPPNTHCFFNLAPENTLYINSHSKTVAPGLRVGYLLSPPKLAGTVAASLRAQCWFTSALNVEIVQRWMDSKASKDWHSIQKAELEKRQRLAAGMLADYDIKLAAGSFHVWLTLPEPWRALEFQTDLEGRGVKVLAADVFAIGRFHAPQAIRICLSGSPTMQVLETGLSIIKQQLDEGYDSRLSVF